MEYDLITPGAAQWDEVPLPTRTTREEVAGEFLHLCLYFLKSFSGSELEVDESVKRAMAFYQRQGRILPLRQDNTINLLAASIKNALRRPLIQRFFAPGIESLREVEFLDRENRVVRIDRVNLPPKGDLEVIEFKLKKPDSNQLINKHNTQVLSYRNIIRSAFKRGARGFIIYFENGEVNEVS